MADRAEILFFSECPSLQTLCSVKLQVPKPVGVNMAMASYQPQLIKSREFIFTEPEIIATPLLSSERRMQVIMQQSLFRSGRLQTRCERLGVKVGQPERVLPGDFQACLCYTLLARLAPLWNKAGDYLLHGRDFITNNQKMSAVKMELKVNENELFLCLKAYQVRLPPITVNELEIPSPVLADFMAERPHAVIFEYSIRNKWVYVLPSLKRGVVVSIHHRIPSDSPFKSYRDMKRYWKNTYGYRIPESDEGMLYYQVYFRPIGDKLFTYPECCVRGHDLSLLPRADSGVITSAFLTDLRAKLPSVCAATLSFSPQPMQHTPSLRESAQAESGCNLLVREAEDTRFRPNPTSVSSTWQPSGSMYKDSHISSTSHGYLSSQQDNDTSTCKLSSVPAKPYVFNTSGFNIDLNQERQSENAVVDKYEGVNGNESRNGHDKISPTQMSVLADQSNKLASSISSRACTTGGATQERGKNTQSTGKIRPVFLPKRPQNLNQKKVPSFKPISHPLPSTEATEPTQKPPKPKPTFLSSVPKPVFSRLTLPRPSVPKPLKPHLPNAKVQESGASGESGYESMAATPMTSAFAAATPKRAPAPLPSPSASIASTPGKRKMQGETAGTPSAKKPRAKAKIQEKMDVAGLAACHQLGKVNSATLVSWLKERKVVCKSKDKKGDLVSRVYNHLSIPEA